MCMIGLTAHLGSKGVGGEESAQELSGVLTDTAALVLQTTRHQTEQMLLPWQWNSLGGN